MYFFADAQGSHLRKHPAIEPIGLSIYRQTTPASTMTAAAAQDPYLVTHRRSTHQLMLENGVNPYERHDRPSALPVNSGTGAATVRATVRGSCLDDPTTLVDEETQPAASSVEDTADFVFQTAR